MLRFTDNIPSSEEIKDGAKTLSSYGNIFYVCIAAAAVCFVISILTTFKAIPLWVSAILFAATLGAVYAAKNKIEADIEELEDIPADSDDE